MEIKKSDKANLENKKAMFFEIGLVLALAFVWGALEWTSKDPKVETLGDETAKEVVEEDIINTEQPDDTPPPPPPAPEIFVSEDLNIVDDDIKVDDVVITTDEDNDKALEFNTSYATVEQEEEEVIEDAIPFQLVEQAPKFMGGGPNEFSKWVNQRLEYPEIAKENGIQGRVMLSFKVGKDGVLTDVKVIRGVDPSLDKEAMRVVKMSPKWEPGRQRDRAVPVTYTFPVIFQLR